MYACIMCILLQFFRIIFKVALFFKLRYAMFMYELYNVSKKADNFVRWVFSNDGRNDPFYVNSTIYIQPDFFLKRDSRSLFKVLFWGTVETDQIKKELFNACSVGIKSKNTFGSFFVNSVRIAKNRHISLRLVVLKS